MTSRTGQMKDLQAEIDRLHDVLKMEVERADNGWKVVEAVQEAVRALVTPKRVPMPLETNLIEALGLIGGWIDDASQSLAEHRELRARWAPNKRPEDVGLRPKEWDAENPTDAIAAK